MPKKILFISKGEFTSSTRYRALQYFPNFIEAGWDPEHVTISGGLVAIIKTLHAAQKASVVVLLRKTFPYPLFWILHKVSKKLIFDFDDAIFCNTDGSYSKTRMQRFCTTVSSCHAVFAGNEYLANEAEKYNPAVEVIPTSVDVVKYNLPANKENGSLNLVWIGSTSTKKYIANIIPDLEEAVKFVPNLQLKIIADFELKSAILPIKNIVWNDQIEAQELCNADIGLAPMPENNWTKGKCALKVLQYMAAGLPVISSSAGVNADVVKDQISGGLVSEKASWSELITQFSRNPASLDQMGKSGKDRVYREYSITIVFQKMLNTINRL